MSEPDRQTPPSPEPVLADELSKIPFEPLLPIEKTLIAWSLILGVSLLGLLAWVSNTFFPASPPPS
jgi:hypothetical protein